MRLSFALGRHYVTAVCQKARAGLASSAHWRWLTNGARLWSDWLPSYRLVGRDGKILSTGKGLDAALRKALGVK